VARVLLLTQLLPFPLDSGAKIRAYYVIRHLAERHDVTLVSFVRTDDRSGHVDHLRRFCQTVYTVPMRRSRARDIRALLLAGLTSRPIVIVRDEISEMHALLRSLVKSETFDIVHADQTSMAQYALYAKSQAARSRNGLAVRLLLDAHNALYRIPQRLAAQERSPLKRLLLRREARTLERYEADVCQRFDRVVFVSDQDRQALLAKVSHSSSQREIRDTRMTTIPICVDPDDKPLLEQVARPRAITHLGTMFWPPNVEGVLWFAREVFPRILAQAPRARLVVLGKNPPRAVQMLACQQPCVEVTGYVADPAPYLAETAAFVVPLHSAGGMRVKILDAWCWGMPIVSTSIGAEGIAVKEGDNILIADTARAFAQSVVTLLEQPGLREQLRVNGRRWVEQRYHWRRMYAQWDEVYRQLAVA